MQSAFSWLHPFTIRTSVSHLPFSRSSSPFNIRSSMFDIRYLHLTDKLLAPKREKDTLSGAYERSLCAQSKGAMSPLGGLSSIAASPSPPFVCKRQSTRCILNTFYFLLSTSYCTLNSTTAFVPMFCTLSCCVVPRFILNVMFAGKSSFVTSPPTVVPICRHEEK